MLLEILLLLTHTHQCCSEVDKRIITSLNNTRHVVKLTIVNGTPTEANQVPYLVSLKEPLAKHGNIRLWGNLCGAAIIKSDGTLLTAAHCFELNNFLYAKRPNLLRAVSGSSRTDITSEGLSGISKDGVQWRQLVKAILHQNFHFPYCDIAIAFVNYPYKEGAVPIALPRSTTDSLGSCFVAGYGRVGHGATDKTSSVLLLAAIEPMPRRLCAAVWDMAMDAFICTSSRHADVSEGDSGGPLWCERAARRPELAGIVSGKSYDKTTLFTRVSAYLDWVNSNGTKRTNASASKLHFINRVFILLYFLFFMFNYVSHIL